MMSFKVFLKEQQCLYEILQSSFLEQKITAKKLFEMDAEFIQTELGIPNKIQAKNSQWPYVV